MSGSTFEKTIDANSLSVGQDLFMRKGATFKDAVDLSGAKVDGQISMLSGIFKKTVKLESSSIKQGIIAREAYIAGEISLLFADIGVGFDLRDATARIVDLSGATVAGELILGGGGGSGLKWLCEGDRTIRWPLNGEAWKTANCGVDEPLPRLTLRNTRVGTIQDAADAWPAGH